MRGLAAVASVTYCQPRESRKDDEITSEPYLPSRNGGKGKVLMTVGCRTIRIRAKRFISMNTTTAPQRMSVNNMGQTRKSPPGSNVSILAAPLLFSAQLYGSVSRDRSCQCTLLFPPTAFLISLPLTLRYNFSPDYPHVPGLPH